MILLVKVALIRGGHFLNGRFLNFRYSIVRAIKGHAIKEVRWQEFVAGHSRLGRLGVASEHSRERPASR